MRATIAWSEDLLTPEEQRALPAAGGVCGRRARWRRRRPSALAPEGAAPLGLDLLEGLSALVDHSLVQQREEGGEPRFGMLHVIREYALERLEASGEAEALRRAHAAYFLALAEQAEPASDRAGGSAPGLDRLEREHDNLRAALGWAREQGEAEIGPAAGGRPLRGSGILRGTCARGGRGWRGCWRWSRESG